jgi:type I restriction enzyme, S subunit
MKKTLSRLPDKWDYKALKKMSLFLRRGRSPVYAEKNMGLFVINQDCIRWDCIELEKAKYHIQPANIADEFYLLPGDILINSTGTGTIGRVNQWNNRHVKAVADSHVTVIRINRLETDPRYIRYFLASEAGQRYLEAICYTGSTNQIELSKRYLSKFNIPCAPFLEQRAIAGIFSKVLEMIKFEPI